MSSVVVRKYIRVLMVGEADVQLRLSDWRLVIDSDDITLVCLNNPVDHFVRHYAILLFVLIVCIRNLM